MLTQERLKQLLDYDLLTGVFLWRVARPSRPIGSIAGTYDVNGYVCIYVDGRSYKAHRLAWLFTHGEWPAGEIDHRDLDVGNNRIENLRLATRSQQNMNRAVRSDSDIGLKGVSYHKSHRKFFARIGVAGRKIMLGYFDDPHEAHAVYCEAAIRYHGEFARTA